MAESLRYTHPEPITRHPTWRIRRAVMTQGWYDLAAIHWRYPPEVVQRLLPEGFTVDTFDGAAWVGLLPFRMRDVRILRIGFGPWSTFPETNVRSYVTDPAGRRAVWFFSLDITRIVPTIVARTTYGLPYCWSRMHIERPETAASPEGGVWRYTTKRRWPRGRGVAPRNDIVVRVGARLADHETTELDDFLTARWALGSTFMRQPMWARVDHPAWPLHAAELITCEQSMVEAVGLPAPEGDSIVRWSPGVDVRIERPRLIRRSTR